jgi:iron complex transport system substrate-binding protein
MRIVSLLPAATEWVHVLGRAHDLVGVTFECDTPHDIRSRARVVVDTVVPPGTPPAEIDRIVRERTAAGLLLYALDEAAMAELAPEVVLTQDLCRVCALPAEEAERVACGAEVVSLDPHRLGEVLDSGRRVGAAIGAADVAEAIVGALFDRLRVVGRSTLGRPRPRVLALEWIDPPFVAGHWVPDIVTAAGGEPLAAVAGGRSVSVAWEDLPADPDVVVVAPCGFGVEDAVVQAAPVLERFPAARVVALDAQSLVTRPGPGVVDAVEALAWALHPDAGLAAPPAHHLRVLRTGSTMPGS